MGKKKPKQQLRWPYLLALAMVFYVAITLRAFEVVGPPPDVSNYKLASDDSKATLVALRHGITKQTSQEVEMPRPLAGQLNVPILMYHRTPADFEAQIKYLVDRGYNSISLNQLWWALTTSAPLPDKPVIITLDDGYTDQLQEIAILRKYNMKATLYMINGGAASGWCIGASAKNLPGCEAYLNWDQLRQIDKEGLITIGSHTINHPALATLSPEQQVAEMVGSKLELEKQLGHPIYDFAYPFGSYNEASVQAAKRAGFRTAVTTQPGSIHTVNDLLALTRLREAYELF